MARQDFETRDEPSAAAFERDNARPDLDEPEWSDVEPSRVPQRSSTRLRRRRRPW